MASVIAHNGFAVTVFVLKNVRVHLPQCPQCFSFDPKVIFDIKKKPTAMYSLCNKRE